MLTELYIEALLVDEVQADQVWELWNAGLISDELGALGWWLICIHSDRPSQTLVIQFQKQLPNFLSLRPKLRDVH